MKISRQEDIDFNLYIEHLQRHILSALSNANVCRGDWQNIIKMPIKILKDMSPHEKPSQIVVDVVMHSCNVSDIDRTKQICLCCSRTVFFFLL